MAAFVLGIENDDSQENGRISEKTPIFTAIKFTSGAVIYMTSSKLCNPVKYASVFMRTWPDLVD